MLQSTVLSLCVLTNDHYIYFIVPGDSGRGSREGERGEVWRGGGKGGEERIGGCLHDGSMYNIMYVPGVDSWYTLAKDHISKQTQSNPDKQKS